MNGRRPDGVTRILISLFFESLGAGGAGGK